MSIEKIDVLLPRLETHADNFGIAIVRSLKVLCIVQSNSYHLKRIEESFYCQETLLLW